MNVELLLILLLLSCCPLFLQALFTGRAGAPASPHSVKTELFVKCHQEHHTGLHWSITCPNSSHSVCPPSVLTSGLTKQWRASQCTDGRERSLETKQNIRIDRLMNPWGGDGAADRRGKKDITQDGWGGGGELASARKAADSESEWGNDVENVITVSI